MPHEDAASTVDRQALAAEMLPRADALVAHMAAVLPPWADRDELLGAAHEALWRATMRYDPARGLKPATYLLTRVHGAVLDAMRSWGRILDEHGDYPLPLSMVIAEDDDGHQVSLVDCIADEDTPSPPAAAERAESDARVTAALARLTPTQAADVQATVMDGLSQSEWAQRTGRTPGAISINRAHGLRRLAPLLAGRPAPKRLPPASRPRQADRAHAAAS